MKLNFRELETLNEFLSFVTDQAYIQVDGGTARVLEGIQNKVVSEIGDLWRPLSELTPLGIKVIVRNIQSGEEREMVRRELASSYSPEFVLLEHDGEPEPLWTKDYVWRHL